MKTFSFAIYYLVCVAALMTTFPIDEYLRNFRFTAASTIVSYLLLGLALSIVAVYIAPWIVSHLFPRLRRSPWADTFLTAVTTFFIFCAFSIFFGPFGLNLLGTRIRGIFFAEWKFVTFIFYDGVLLSILAAGLRRYKSTVKPEKKGRTA